MTRFSMFGAFALLFLAATGLLAQQPRISVFACDLREKPVVGARFRIVDVVSSDSSSPTDGFGRTDILLHKAVKAGNLVQVTVTNPDYILVSPWNSRVLVPAF